MRHCVQRSGVRVALGRVRSLAVVAGLAAGLSAAGVTARAQELMPQSPTSLMTPVASSCSTVTPQGAKPNPLNVANGFDGIARSVGMAIFPDYNGDPYENIDCSAFYMVGEVNVATGSYAPMSIDSNLPWAGPTWPIARSYNSQQGYFFREPTGYDETKKSFEECPSYGPQGTNWFQNSMPGIVMIEMHTQGGASVPKAVKVVSGADSYLSFEFDAVRTTGGTSRFVYKGVNGNSGRGEYIPGSNSTPDLFTITNRKGVSTTFFGTAAGYYSSTGNDAAGKIWKQTDAAGRSTVVGTINGSNVFTASTTSAVTGSAAYATAGKLVAWGQVEANGTVRRNARYTFNSATVPQLTNVSIYEGTGSSTVLESVAYEYYSGTGDNGSDGELKLVTVTTPLSTGASLTRNTLYRYRKPSSPLLNSRIRMVIGPEGYRRYSAIGTVETAGDGALAAYADSVFEYASSDPRGRVTSATFSGMCGCSGGGTSGTYTFSYGPVQNGTKTNEAIFGVPGTTPPAYSAASVWRTTITQPDGLAIWQYFDVSGQATHTIKAVGTTSPQTWATLRERDSKGRFIKIGTPAAASGSADLVDPDTTSNRASGGLVTVISRVGTGIAAGLPSEIGWSDSWSATPTKIRSMTYSTPVATDVYDSGGTGDQVLYNPLLASSSVYPDGTTAETTSYSYASYYSGLTILPTAVTVTAPTVSTTKNGSGAATSTDQYFRIDGSVWMLKDQLGIYGYTGRNWMGQPVLSVRDFNPSSLSSLATSYNADGDTSSISVTGNTPLASWTGYDSQGRMTSSGRSVLRENTAAVLTTSMSYGKVSDGRPVVLTTATDGTKNAPGSLTVVNLAGRTELTATVEAHITDVATLSTSGSATPLDVVRRGTNAAPLTAVGTSTFDPTGTRLLSSATYFNTPTAIPGSSSNFDETTYDYDGMGRVTKAVDPTETITQTVFDALGRVKAMKKGSGTTLETVEERYYDGATTSTLTVGNGYLTRMVRVLSDTVPSSNRTTSMYYDVRGRVKGVDNPIAPHTATAYDNLNRPLARAEFSAEFTSASAAPSSLTSSSPTSGRLSFSETFYDERGQVYKSVLHHINQPNQSSPGTSSASITTNKWYDARGQQIASIGSQLSKITYDRLGRSTVQYTLATVGATTYAAASDVTGDVVLEQRHTIYDTATSFNPASPTSASSSGQAVLSVSFSRNHNSTLATTGGLAGTAISGYGVTPSNAAGARVQSTAMWTDGLGRSIASANYGANSVPLSVGSSGTAAPTSSDTAKLVSRTEYDDFGRVLRSIDAGESGGTPTAFGYDGAGRKVTEIRNAVGGAMTSPTRDNDLYTRYTYSKGLLSSIRVDLEGDGDPGSDDQVTIYDYSIPTGTAPAGPPVKNLLRKVTYPAGQQTGGSGSSNNIVRYGYNRLGQQTEVWDQNGTTRLISYDKAGRKIAETVPTFGTLASGISVDSTVGAVLLGYNPRGQIDNVRQYADGTGGITPSGSPLDEVIYRYDGWGNVIRFGQDHNGEYAETSTSDSVVVDSAFSLTTSSTARSSSRRDSITLKQAYSAGATARVWRFAYGSADINAAVGRVSQMKLDDGSNTVNLPIADYQYLGASMLVGTSVALSSGSLDSNLFTGSGGSMSYDALDAFNRTIKSRWVNSGGAVLFNELVTYDSASAITKIEDPTFRPGMGVHQRTFTHDKLHRLTLVQEGDSATAPSTFGTEDWRPSTTAGQTVSRTGNWTKAVRSNPAWGATERSLANTFNRVNELLSIANTVGGTTTTYSQMYSPNGELIDDGQRYVYRYDAWGRLTQVASRTNTSVIVSKYKYNGLGFRIGWQYHQPNGAGGPGISDGSNPEIPADPWFWLVYNDRWQQIAAYRLTTPATGWTSAANSLPKEVITHHMAGIDGSGGSSYIDSVVARERDNTAWEANAEAVSSWAIASRQLLLQNWRADVVRATDSLGTITDRIRYTAYGEPQRYSLFDVGRPSGNIPDGSFDYDDYVAFLESLAIGDASVDPAADVDHDGTIDGADYTAFMNAYASDDEGPLGTGHLSRELDVGFRRGYAGYEFDPVLGASSASIYHVRNRVYDAENGRWNRRDPLGYVDGMGLYEYVKSGAVDYKDPLGLALSGGCSGSACRGAELVGNNANARCRSGHVNLNQDLPIVTPPLPPSIPGPNRPEAFECERACSSVSALAINYCINGVLTICICPLLYLNYSASESFLSQYYPCLIAFETQTSLGLSCIPGKTGIPEIGTPNQGETPQQTLNRLVSSICNKASAYAALHECAKRIDCTKGSDASKRPWCEYHKCLEVYQTGCLARKLQALCENGRNRPYNQVQSEFSAAFSDCSLNNAPCFRPLR